VSNLKIACDVDGCILSFAKVFSEWWNTQYEPKLSPMPLEWSWGLQGIKKALLYEEVPRFLNSDKAGRLPYAFDDVVEYFNRISGKHEVVIVTAFPEHRKPAREENLKELNYSKLIMCPIEDKAKFIIEEIDPDIVIEDKPGTVECLVRHAIPVCVPRWGYTKHLEKYCKMFGTWSELYKLIEEF